MLEKTDKKFIVQLLLIILAGIMLVVKIDLIGNFISNFLRLLTPLFVGIILALFLNRPIEYLKIQFRKIPFFNNQRAKIPAIIISFVLFLGVLVGLFLIIVPQLIDSFGEFMVNFDRYSQSFTNIVNQASEWVKQYNIDPNIISNLGDKGLQLIGSIIESLPGMLSSFLSGLVSTIVAFFLGLIISIYILTDKKRLKRQFRRITGAIAPVDKLPRFNHVFMVVQKTFSTYIYTQLTESLILGVLFFIATSIIGFPYPLIVSVLNGLSVLIPIVGAWLGGIAGGIIILFAKPDMIIGYGIFVVLMQLFENNFIYPKRVNHSVGLPQIWVLVAITVGAGLFGIVGAFLAVPIASVLYQILTEKIERKEQKRRLTANEILQEKGKQRIEADSETVTFDNIQKSNINISGCSLNKENNLENTKD